MTKKFHLIIYLLLLQRKIDFKKRRYEWFRYNNISFDWWNGVLGAFIPFNFHRSFLDFIGSFRQNSSKKSFRRRENKSLRIRSTYYKDCQYSGGLFLF